jgi:hypothetical protein
VKIVNSQNLLFHMVDTGRSASRFSCRLNGGQQESNQHADDCNDDQQFNEREAKPLFVRTAYPPPFSQFNIFAFHCTVPPLILDSNESEKQDSSASAKNKDLIDGCYQ